jgi:hypothetical protein
LKKVHFTCPLCGRRAAESSLSTQFPIEFWLQEFGWFKGRPRPTMSWNRINGGSSLVNSLRIALVHKLELLAARFGYRLEPLMDAVSVIHRPVVSVSQQVISISVIGKPEVVAR